MTYDLALFARFAVDVDAVRRWLSGRRHWTTTWAEPALYENEATGVFLVLDLDRSATGGAGSPPVTARIPLGVPSFFIREIEPELTALVSEFDFAVHDTQTGLSGLYRADTLRHGWLRSNPDGENGVTRPPRNPLRLPTEKLTAAWAWNRSAADLQHHVGEEIFVPRIQVFRIAGAPTTVVLWPDGHPTLFPAVDAVVIGREHLARRDFVFGGRRVDVQPLPWADVATMIGPHGTPRTDGGLNYVPRTIPPEVTRWLRRLPRGAAPPLKGFVPMHEVRDDVPPTSLAPLPS